MSYSGEGVASVGDKHACLSNSSISHSDTFDKSSCAHLFLLISSISFVSEVPF